MLSLWLSLLGVSHGSYQSDIRMFFYITTKKTCLQCFWKVLQTLFRKRSLKINHFHKNEDLSPTYLKSILKHSLEDWFQVSWRCMATETAVTYYSSWPTNNYQYPGNIPSGFSRRKTKASEYQGNFEGMSP